MRPFRLWLCTLMLSGYTAAARHHHFFYLSWGYNGDWYSTSTLHVKQDALGNDYQMNSVTAHDHKGWNEHFFQQQLTIPQYNYRLGFMFNEEKGLGIEINFDHVKYIIVDQQVHITGKLNGNAADTTISFAGENGFHYYLNNGANFFLINAVKRQLLFKTHDNWLRIDALGKAGIGPVVPHVDNTLFGHDNDPKFQLGGWNTGVEGDLKFTVQRYAYLEYGFKYDYARYSGLKVYEGTAHQAFSTFEMILSFGIHIPGKRWKEKENEQPKQ